MTKIDYAKEKVRKQLEKNRTIPVMGLKGFKKHVASQEPLSPPAPAFTVDVLPPPPTPNTPPPGAIPYSATRMMVTVEQAYKWLEGAVHNRPLRNREVMKIAYDISNHRWKFNGESVVFGWDGVLLDGQHRLYAAIEAGLPFETLVVTGIDPETFTTIDQGKHRSPSDHLFAAKVEVPPNTMKFVATTAALVYKYRINGLLTNMKINPELLIEIVRSEPAIIDWVVAARKSPKGIKSFAPAVAAALHVGSETKPDHARRFLHDWTTGENLSAGNPVLTLRARMINKPPLVAWERLLIVVSAWNAYARDSALLKMGSLRGDSFPPIVGEANQ